MKWIHDDRAFDEAFEGGRPRSHYRALIAALESFSPYEIDRRERLQKLSLVDQGITFTVYGEKEGIERIFPFDFVPRIVPAAECTRIHVGLVQRVTTLNPFIADVYGEQRCLRDRVVPVELVLSRKEYNGGEHRWPSDDHGPAGSTPTRRPAERRRVKRWSPFVAVVLLAGCAEFHPTPVEPERTEADLRGRTLSDAGLRAFVEANATPTTPAFPPASWDLSMLTLVAFYYHPDLDIARERVTLAEAGVRTAGARPNPGIGLRPAYDISPVEGTSPWTAGFSFDLPIETAGKRGYRIARAERLTDAARLDLAQTGWQVRSRLRAALVDHLLAARTLDLLREEAHVRSESVAVMERRLGLGDVSRPDVDLARIDLAATQLAIRAAEGEVARTRVALAAALGLPVSALAGTTIGWPGLEAMPAEAEASHPHIQRAGLLNRLDVRRALAEYAAFEAALQLEIAKQYPDVHLGPGYLFEEGANKFSLGLTITLPMLDQNQGPIAEAEARRREAAARFLALQSRIIAETDGALARYLSARRELDDADRALVLLGTQEAAVRRGLELGEQDRLALVGIQLQRTVAARRRLDALLRAQTALGALEDAVQRPLADAAAVPAVLPVSPRGAAGSAGEPR